jgi:hypothetical protein
MSLEMKVKQEVLKEAALRSKSSSKKRTKKKGYRSLQV